MKAGIISGVAVFVVAVVVAAVAWGSHMGAAAAQQQIAATQTAAAVRQTVTAQQTAKAEAQQTVVALVHQAALAQKAADASAQQTVVAANAEGQQTAAARQTATAEAQQVAVGIRASAQETAAAAEAQDTAVAQQAAKAAVQQRVVAQQTADAMAQQAVAAAQTAAAPHDTPTPPDTPLGFWNHKCVVQSINSDETVTYDSDSTWANNMCSALLADSNGAYVSFPENAARPGYIQCAFIRLYGSGMWREFSNYANPPSGDEQVAVRSTNWADASTDCSNLENWIAQQNAASGN